MNAPQSTFPLRVGAKSDPGKVRSENQDRISRFVSPFGEVVVVADGMGGHQDGGKGRRKNNSAFQAGFSV